MLIKIIEHIFLGILWLYVLNKAKGNSDDK